ncbi:MAG: carbon-nitrogen hydrolase family protein [Anaerolineales bacterium]
MRLALIPLRVWPRQVERNLAELERRLEEAAHFSPDLVCLPECTLTGYLYDQADLERFAETLSGALVARFSELARRFKVYLCAGLLERALEGVYDTALLFDGEGRLLGYHRKIEEQPPFLCGQTFRPIESDLGRLGILICGDLFNEDAVRQARHAADLLLVPMSRGLDGRSPDPDRWEAEERAAYLDAARATKTIVAMVNALELEAPAPAFGGALVVNAEGLVVGESPHGSDEILFVEIAK